MENTIRLMQEMQREILLRSIEFRGFSKKNRTYQETKEPVENLLKWQE